jgi:lipoprotein NlpI
MSQATSSDPAREFFERGNELRGQRRFPDAIAAFRDALAFRPRFPEALINLGHLLELTGQYPEAIASYRAALAIDATRPETHLNLGNALLRAGQPDAALAAYRAALALKPGFAEAHLNAGNILQLQNDLDAAEACYARALALRPDYADAHVNLGKIHRARNHLAAALASCRRALALNPSLPQAHLNEGLIHLVSGDLRAGWPKAEFRWEITQGPLKRTWSVPVWHGGVPLAGKTILLHAEQGLGDTLQFVRYVPKVAALGARICLEVSPSLKPLLATLPHVAEIRAHGEELPHFDFHCPLLSLPLAFGTELDSVPSEVPYLTVPPDRIARWSKLLGPGPGPRVGLAWSGHPGHPNDRNRSVPFDAFQTICAPLGAVRYFNLKIEASREDVLALQAAPHITDLAEQVHDFADTAALVAQMDLVISVDTSVAHLAGALGRPVWLLTAFSPDWRWLMERRDSPWYPTMWLFRQPRIGDWAPVLSEVRSELGKRYEI